MIYAATISEDNNIGSLREVNLAMAYWFSALKPVTFYTGYGWENMDFLPENTSVKDSSKDSPNGIEYTYTLVFAFNKQNADLYNTFLKYLGQNGIVQFTDNNGLTRIIGTVNNPVTCTHDSDTGQAYASLNYYKVTVNWLHCEPAIVVS